MPIVEHNDVDLSKLFLWSKETTIKGAKDKEIKVYLRLLGDADINRARVMALRKSAELRKAMRDTESDERLAFVPELVEIEEGMLTEYIILYTMRDLTKKAMQDVVIPKPKDPGSDATTERLEKYQQEVDDYPKTREKAIGDLLKKLIDARRIELNLKPVEELYNMYINVLINELCEQELMDRFKDYCLLFGTYSDKKLTTRLFSSFEEVDNLSRDVKIHLKEEYELLDVETESLKK